MPTPSITASVFNFGGSFGGVRRTEPATSITVSKADTVGSLEFKLRHTLSLSLGEIRCYKVPLKRKDSPPSKFKVHEVNRLIPDRTDTLDFSDPNRMVGEIGIVEPCLGIAVEWKGFGGTWPMDEPVSSSGSSSKDEGSVDVDISGAGHRLGSSPMAMPPFNRRRRSSSEKNVLGSDDEAAPLGTLNGKTLLGPVMPGSYPRAISPVQRPSSADRYGERNKISFNSRINVPPKVERVPGTIGLNNLGMLPQVYI